MEIYDNLSVESIPNEEWRDIVGWEGLYQVSNLGRVKSLSRSIVYKDGREYTYPSKIIKNQKVSTGYRSVMFYGVNGKKQYYVHRLVAETFIPNPKNLGDVNHKDGCKTNNIILNLEWCSRSDNIKHAYKKGLICAHMDEAIKNVHAQLFNMRQAVKLLPNTLLQTRLQKQAGVIKDKYQNIVDAKIKNIALIRDIFGNTKKKNEYF